MTEAEIVELLERLCSVEPGTPEAARVDSYLAYLTEGAA